MPTVWKVLQRVVPLGACLLGIAGAVQAAVAVQVPDEMDMGSLRAGSRGAPVVQVISNSGDEAVTIEGLRMLQPAETPGADCAGAVCTAEVVAFFRVSAGECAGRTLEPRQSCRFTVDFMPGAAQGPVQATLGVFTDKAPVQRVRLRGEGRAGTADPGYCMARNAQVALEQWLPQGQNVPLYTTDHAAACRVSGSRALCVGVERGSLALRQAQALLFDTAGSPALQAVGPATDWMAALGCEATEEQRDQIVSFVRPYDGQYQPMGDPPQAWLQFWPERFYVVRSEAAWRAAWDAVDRAGQPVPSLPAIDFSRHTLVGVTAQCSVRIERIVRRAGAWQVELQPSRGGQCAMVPAVDFVLIPRTDEPVQMAPSTGS